MKTNKSSRLKELSRERKVVQAAGGEGKVRVRVRATHVLNNSSLSIKLKKFQYKLVIFFNRVKYSFKWININFLRNLNQISNENETKWKTNFINNMFVETYG